MTDLQEDPGLSHESWRPKFYGLITEGHKARVSQRALKLGLLILALLILGSQIVLSWETNGASKKEVSFKVPAVRGLSTTPENIFVPPVTNSAKEIQREKQEQAHQATLANQRLMKIEPIKAIKLSQIKEIPSGAEIMAFLSSGASNGLVKAVLSENMKYNGDLLLPKGTVLIGKGSSSEERLYIQFTRAISPDKSTLKVKAFAFDNSDRIIGLKGKKISDYAFKLASSAGLVFLGGMADGLRDDYSANPFSTRRPSVKDAALNGVSTATAETAKDLIKDMNGKESRVEVASSTPILVIFGDVE